MSVGGCHGCTVIKPSEASAAMAMVALKTEPKALTMAFSNKLVPLGIKSSMTLEAVLKETRKVFIVFDTLQLVYNKKLKFVTHKYSMSHVLLLL